MAARIKLNKAGVAALLRHPRMQADLDRRARRIAAAAGSGHRVESSPTRLRARSVVVTDTYEARRREATNRSLSAAVDAGRG
jgi:hypothetical protein